MYLTYQILCVSQLLIDLASQHRFDGSSSWGKRWLRPCIQARPEQRCSIPQSPPRWTNEHLRTGSEHGALFANRWHVFSFYASFACFMVEFWQSWCWFAILSHHDFYECHGCVISISYGEFMVAHLSFAYHGLSLECHRKKFWEHHGDTHFERKYTRKL